MITRLVTRSMSPKETPFLIFQENDLAIIQTGGLI